MPLKYCEDRLASAEKKLVKEANERDKCDERLHGVHDRTTELQERFQNDQNSYMEILITACNTDKDHLASEATREREAKDKYKALLDKCRSESLTCTGNIEKMKEASARQEGAKDKCDQDLKGNQILLDQCQYNLKVKNDALQSQKDEFANEKLRMSVDIEKWKGTADNCITNCERDKDHLASEATREHEAKDKFMASLDNCRSELLTCTGDIEKMEEESDRQEGIKNKCDQDLKSNQMLLAKCQYNLDTKNDALQSQKYECESECQKMSHDLVRCRTRLEIIETYHKNELEYKKCTFF